ncbi:MAG TPA: DNA-directed RNA polymerase subunit alpha C-terminal domain-containing protein [Solirubrobacterales bacterium]|nr:DNA-directed RNA polymerase subunit alpha C-terminal domain-containing protein [Solirubrobacterales bacterium]
MQQRPNSERSEALAADSSVPCASSLERLIGRTPDPLADRPQLTELCDQPSPAVSNLVTRLYTQEDWQHATLRELLPGLDLVYAPSFTDRLSVRAANSLGRVRASTLTSLAALSPWEILRLPNVGEKSVREILSVVIAEWASAYLEQTEGRASSHPSKGLEIPARKPRSLANALASFEQTGGFLAFKRRHLDPGKRPSLAAVGAELDVTPERVRQMQKAAWALLSRRMQQEDSPIRHAVERLHERLGSLASAAELKNALEEIDPLGEALPDGMPHRLTMLLLLAEYHVSEEWVVGPDIEVLTNAVLSMLTESKSANLENIGRYLSRLGVREDLQLPWIRQPVRISIIDGDLVRA